MKYLIAVLVLMMTGCASVQDLRSQSPEVTYTSEKAPNTVTSCIAEKWQNITANTTVSPTQNGSVVIVPNGLLNAPLIMADITKSDIGSTVALRSNGGMKKYRETIVPCF